MSLSVEKGPMFAVGALEETSIGDLYAVLDEVESGFSEDVLSEILLTCVHGY